MIGHCLQNNLMRLKTPIKCQKRKLEITGLEILKQKFTVDFFIIKNIRRNKRHASLQAQRWNNDATDRF